MSGRRVIKSGATYINSSNLLDVLDRAMAVHELNKTEIEYLWNYYRGVQPILNRIKEVRPEICNKMVENHANEIVSFKVGYLCGEPIQYVGRKGDENITNAIIELNELMYAEDKATKDQEIVEWSMVVGTAYRVVLPDEKIDEEGAPFELFTLDPGYTFVVYSSDIGSKPLMAVKYRVDENDMKHFSIYTDTFVYSVVDGAIKSSTPHQLGMIPIIEYPANNARLGSFEIVLPLLDAINNLESNRMDGVEQFIQAFWKFIGCKLDKEKFQSFLEEGAIFVPPNDGGGNIDVDLVVKEMNQDQSQTLKDNLYTAILTICGMPNRNGGSSTSDTGAAVIMRDGWTLAEARAKDSEHMFKKSEKQMLKLVLRICRDLATTDLNLRLRDISLKFTRRNYEAIQSKSQVLISMLEQDKIHPLLAFESSGLFIDPESAYALSMKYYEEQLDREVVKTQEVEKPTKIAQ